MSNTDLQAVLTDEHIISEDKAAISRVVLADNDVEFAGALKQYLERDRFAITVVHDGQAAVFQALSGKHDVVVLEAGMPGMDGVQALREIRMASQVPVLMITSRDDEVNRIFGLGLSADDYVPKPFSPRELLARLRAALAIALTPASSRCFPWYAISRMRSDQPPVPSSTTVGLSSYATVSSFSVPMPPLIMITASAARTTSVLRIQPMPVAIAIST